MNRFINYYPGDTRNPRGLELGEFDAYGRDDISGFVDSLLAGCTASTPIDGALAALEDGSVWGDLCDQYGEGPVQEALEELHALLIEGMPQKQPGPL